MSKDELEKLASINSDLKGNNSHFHTRLIKLDKLDLMDKETLQSIDDSVRSSAENTRKMLANTERFIKNPNARPFWEDNFPTVFLKNDFFVYFLDVGRRFVLVSRRFSKLN